jgi:hypothetical protein
VTIAACYLSPEGVVLGADSTTTYDNSGNPHFYNNAQKLFEIGVNCTWGLVTWGLGGLAVNSHRTLAAILADDLQKKPPQAPIEIAERWIDLFWPLYSASPQLLPFMQRCQALHAMAAYSPTVPPSPTVRTQDEQLEYVSLRNGLTAGFCIAGYVESERKPAAFEVIFDPTGGKPVTNPLNMGFSFWGAPNMIQRLILGCDDGLKDSILNSPKWVGTEPELTALISSHQLAHAFTIPIRDAIDFVHACIYSTIKAMKFSSLSQICGGPIELAVITTDRKFRWVRHKPWDAAIIEGDVSDVQIVRRE